jgi:hypothetical protein
MKKIYLPLLAALVTTVGYSQHPFTEAASTHTENFDAIGTSQTASLPANWRVSVNALLPRQVDSYSSAGTATTQRGGNNLSTSAANGIYNFGAGDPAAATDRAVGGLSSGSNSKSVNIYHYVRNTGTEDISDFTISYDVEKYRNGTNAAGFAVTLYYSFDGSTWQEAPPIFQAVFAPGPDNTGSTPAPSGFTSITEQNLNISLPVNGNMYFAWNYSVASGTTTSNAIALGLDNVTITANYPSVMPLKLTDFRLMQRSNTVQLDWTALNEDNMDRHEVQKSTNGVAFNVVGALSAQNNTTSKYTYTDGTPNRGYNYYRLRFLNRSGEFTYSQILRINMGQGKTDLGVLSNPVYNGNLNLQLNNLTRGKYFIRLFNSVGQQVYSRSMDHPGGSSTETINLPNTVNRGMYFLQMTNGETRFNKQVMVN